MIKQTEKLEKQTEQLLLRSMGAYGYIKVPYAFTKKYPYDKDTVRDPVDVLLTEMPDEVHLTFVWKKAKAGGLDNDPARVKAKQEDEQTPKE